jgi:hypothetical protein
MKNGRVKVLSGALVVVAIIAVVYFSINTPGKKPPPSEAGYYTGPMRPKGGQDILATEDGKVTALPDSMKKKKDSKPSEGAPAKGGAEKPDPSQGGE